VTDRKLKSAHQNLPTALNRFSGDPSGRAPRCLRSKTLTDQLKLVHNPTLTMNIRSGIRRALFCAGLMWAGMARATLGGDAASVQAYATAVNGRIRTDSPVRMLQIDVDNGIQVREWLDAAGLVFAVSWSGPAPPDLGQLLGSYYREYVVALSALSTPGRRRAVHVRTADLVLDSEGYLRGYAGRAYLPARLPLDVAATSLR